MIYVIVIPWVVGVYQNKCPCHKGAARVPGGLFRYSPVSNHGITILYPD